MIELQLPNIKHKKAYEKLIREWGETEKIPTAPWLLFAKENLEELIEFIKNDKIHGKKGLESYLYFLVEDEEILGALRLRINIKGVFLGTMNLEERGGHIGYGIAPKYRKKGYATIMLSLALKEAKKLGLEKVLLTCDVDNIASNKTILKNGGVFERLSDDGANRYWIDLKTYDEFENFWNKKWENTGLIEENEFAKKILRYFPNGQNKKILDLGAGSGRDSLFFAKKRFKVEAFDFSENALNNLKNFAEKEKFNIKTTIGNTQNFDFGKSNYDFIYACNSLHYFSLETTKNIFSKLKKSLKKGGYFFLRVKSVDDVDFGKGEKLEENFYKNNEDIKYYFTKKLVEDLFTDFEILELSANQDKHNKISGEVTINGFIDLVAKK